MCQLSSNTQQRLYQYKQAHLVDPVCYYIMKYCKEEWNNRHYVETSSQAILEGSIPKCLQKETLQHIQKCPIHWRTFIKKFQIEFYNILAYSGIFFLSTVKI